MVIEVGDYKMTAKDFADQLARRISNFDALAAREESNISRTKEQISQDFIFSSILKTWAKKNNIEVTQKALTIEINQIRENFPDDLSFRRELAEQGLSYNEWENKVRDNLIEKEVFKQIANKMNPVQEDEIKAYYQSNAEKFKVGERIYLRQIVLAQEIDANEVQSSLAKKPFIELAKEFSIAPEKTQGGLVGWVEKGVFEVFDKGFSLPLNKPSEIIKSSFGFHILLVEKKERPGLKPLPEVREFIIKTINASKEQAFFSSWLDEQLRSTKVLKNKSAIDAMRIETRND